MTLRDLSLESSGALGNAAEEMAARHLQHAGLEVIGRNVVVEGHEIDIIALDERCLCFVEVRSRRRSGDVHPLETVTPQKSAGCVGRASSFWLTMETTSSGSSAVLM